MLINNNYKWVLVISQIQDVLVFLFSCASKLNTFLYKWEEKKIQAIHIGDSLGELRYCKLFAY